ncbi:MAG TPA: sensor domain-containing diguanylate cyclase [Candidatus Omnitrophota bacterium]|nr:sensor domain-containing diguanylate cyclase [Candidatus Omnitrophota bacterium]HPS19488.1 sensor domain-containing diguanylate cyclase [Candidatus Omnitrophota bacterium]
MGLLCGLVYLVPLLNNRVQHLELFILSFLVMLTLAVMLFWALLGAVGGLLAFLLAMIFIYKPLTGMNPYYYSILLMAFFLNGILGHYIYKKINRSKQEYTVTIEKVEEDTNLIKDHFENRVAEISAMEEKIDSLIKLKGISDELNLSLSTEEVIKISVDRTFDKFKGDVRVMLFLVDDKTKELVLSTTVKADNRETPQMKKGGIFERWVMKNMQSLLVKDINKDYRFSVEGEDRGENIISLMCKPLISEGYLCGILRVDSTEHDRFSQHDLRILDIVGELTAVGLENAKLYKKTEELAISDSLTGLYVHRYFMERLEEEVKRALRSSSVFSLLILDIDDFKNFNDRYGHIAGDIVLKNVSRVLKNKSSAGDIICRYGGEEFAFIALNHNRESALKLAEEIREEVQNSFVTIRRENKSVTVSIGIAVFPDDAKLREDLIWEADRRMYQAKTKGKNRVVCSK